MGRFWYRKMKSLLISSWRLGGLGGCIDTFLVIAQRFKVMLCEDEKKM